MVKILGLPASLTGAASPRDAAQETEQDHERGTGMRLWPRRRTDAKFLEGGRKTLRPWCLWFIRIALVVCGLFVLGTGLWSVLKCFEVASILGEFVEPVLTEEENRTAAELLRLLIRIGLSGGMHLALALWTILLIIALPAILRTRRLMLKYHDALVAHGISPDEESKSD